MSREPAIDETLALLRSAGVGRFAAEVKPPSPTAGPATPPRADRSDNIDETLALLRSVGVGRFGTTTALETRSPAPQADDGADVLQLIRASGLAGYDQGKVAATAPSSKSSATQAQSAASPGAQPLQAMASPPGTAPKPPVARLSRQQFAVLDIAPGGEAALSQLEANMGIPFAADSGGSPYWYGASDESGGGRRAFSVMNAQCTQLKHDGLLGELGTPELRLSLSGIDVKAFKPAGPGATDWHQGRGAPQLPQRLPDALRVALGR